MLPSPPLSEFAFRKAIDDAVLAGLAAVGLDGRQSYVNRAFANMVGWSEEELVGATAPFVYWPEEEIENILQAFNRTLTGTAPPNGFELRFKRKNGERFDVLVAVAQMIAEDGSVHGWLASVSDISEQKRAEAALRESERQLRDTLDSVQRLNRDLNHRVDELQGLLDVSPIGLALGHDPECRLITVNPAFADMLGIDPGINASKSVPEGEKLKFRVFSGGKELAPDELPMQRAAAENVEIRDFEEDIRHDSGRTLSVLAYATPLHAEDGTVRGVLGAFVDITKLKEAEARLRELNEHLEARVRERTEELSLMNVQLRNEIEERIRAERDLERVNGELMRSNRELQDFAHVASHDLQEPLRKITSFADLITSDHLGELTPESLSYIERIQDAALRMAGLINDLLMFSRLRMRSQQFERVNLNAIAEEVLSDLEVQLRDVEGTVELSELPEIEADATQMRQLFQNLIGNALKFRRFSEKPVVSVRAEAATSKSGRELLRLIFDDNGIGFDERYVERIFSPFQRLHERTSYPGSGMGLAICRRIVEHHHGEITARSTLEIGSSFIVTLPVRQFERTAEEKA